MSSYFYHLKFELYPTSDPTAASRRETTSAAVCSDSWLPSALSSIFDKLPAHPQRKTSDDEIEFHGRVDGQSNLSPTPTTTSTRDWRFGRVSIETIDPSETEMADEAPETSNGADSAAAPPLGPSFPGPGTATKATCRQLNTHHTEAGWGVVHFYREEQETVALQIPVAENYSSAENTHGATTGEEQDCRTLCIPAVPAYMSPGDLWGFVGERWQQDISHCRLVMTSTVNRYLVLLKFKSSKIARDWKRMFDGKVFNTMEPQVCHVVFVKSITFETPSQRRTLEPQAASSSSAAVSNTLKPFPPPTPNLVELPTCPVCLERMDETSGIMTIPCSHVFHCTCLQNWKGGGCPVCRFTSVVSDESDPFKQPFGTDASNFCSICDCTDDLWICLICGYVGCGRYKGGHAKDHWKETAHSFSLELETQYVWDYAGDVWVHRLIRDKGDGKVVELPGRSDQRQGQQTDEDVVPRAKLDNIGFEYTHLMTSQLESQRSYYEEMVSKAASKASKASATAESVSRQASAMTEQLRTLEEKLETLNLQTVPGLERDAERERGRAKKSEALARQLGKALQEEKKVSEGLLRRIEHLGAERTTMEARMEALRKETDELREMNRDLTIFISGQEKLQEMEREGELGQGEIEGGSASVPAKKARRRGGK